MMYTLHGDNDDDSFCENGDDDWVYDDGINDDNGDDSDDGDDSDASDDGDDGNDGDDGDDDGDDDKIVNGRKPMLYRWWFEWLEYGYQINNAEWLTVCTYITLLLLVVI